MYKLKDLLYVQINKSVQLSCKTGLQKGHYVFFLSIKNGPLKKKRVTMLFFCGVNGVGESPPPGFIHS